MLNCLLIDSNKHHTYCAQPFIENTPIIHQFNLLKYQYYGVPSDPTKSMDVFDINTTLINTAQ